MIRPSRFAIAGTLAGALLALAGCVTPQVEDPRATALAPQSLGLTGTPMAPVAAGWWKAFGDPQLDKLVDQALANSPSLQAGLARVRAAQAQSLSISAEDRPGVSIDGEASRQRLSANYIVPPPYGGHTYWVSNLGANLSWNLDFWGKQAAQLSQARDAQAASELDVEAARLALAGAIAQAYVDLHRAWTLSDIADRQLAQREHLLKLTQQRVDTGLDTQIELKTAQAALPAARNAQLQAQATRDLAVHRLAALAGLGADHYAEIGRPKLTLDAALPLPNALPMDLLSRRPDILAAQARIRSAMAGREAAHAAFYPDVSLKAFAGVQAIGLDNLFDGDSAIFGVTPAFHLPIFEARRLRAGYKGATAELDAAVAHYNDTVLNAVRESADQITLGDSLSAQLAQSHEQLQASEAAYSLAQKRYGAGLSTQLTVLNAESQVLQAQRELAAIDANLVISRVTLLLTLGGSFDPQAVAASAGISPLPRAGEGGPQGRVRVALSEQAPSSEEAPSPLADARPSPARGRGEQQLAVVATDSASP
ncbi:efflux transporter outer membrane subunit [Hydrocarboniphaga sp.]|uniref:efflux transporter outer membrane subunit n=1 Tax=Hydrocarboniphaga sp. TaxID=2033016 RepID=UPI002AB9A622|nr:efflux transporter outer membrane subunit [Hydrocarboniphaga sp.]MDZ4077749.1 efflux transporter outer membrane subunit [Hydrocarboniphaga sp.]